MKPVLFLLLFLCANSSWAESSVVAFDKLKSLYQSAAAPRSHDIAVAALSKSTKCAQSSSSNPNLLDDVYTIGVLLYTTPGNGPEFPSVTHKAIAVLAYDTKSESARYVLDTYRPVVTAQELQIETYKLTKEFDCSGLDLNDPDSDCDEEIRRVPVKLNMKLSTNYVHYQIGTDIYGYCWKP